MTRRGERGARSLALTTRGAIQLLLGGALLACGLLGGWLAPGAAGVALLAGCATGLAEVLLARRGHRQPGRARLPLAEASARTESWVRVDQHGAVVERLARPDTRRGLYRQQSVRLSWTDALGFWRATLVEPASRELRVPPAVSPELLRAVSERRDGRLAERDAARDMASVRLYERGDGIRQISWRQTAHHGELMSFERAGREAPPVLMVADVLDAHADEVAATTAALLQGLRRTPDMLLTDGELALRTPVQQERFCAALTPERLTDAEVARRARGVARLAETGSGRRRVALVTTDPEGPLARALLRGPIGRSVTVVRARRAGEVGRAREGRTEQDHAPDARTLPEALRTRPGIADELLSTVGCCALALLALVPLNSMIHEGAWQGVVPALLLAGAFTGSLVGALLRWGRARRAVRAMIAALLAVAILAVGVVVALTIFDGRQGPVAVPAALGETLGAEDVLPSEDASSEGALDDPLGTLRVILETGTEQLAGTSSDEGTQAWDILVVLMGSALAALTAALASSRALRGALALVPLGLSAADQSIMASAATLGDVWLVVALGLLLVWLSVTPHPRAPRAALVGLLACALGAGGAAVAPSGDFSPWSAPGGLRVQTLVDLSRDLRNQSNERVLTYETTALGPVYLRLGVLDSFDGSTWRFEGSLDASAEGNSPLYRAGQSGGISENSWAASLAPLVTTTLVPSEGAGASVPVPPGTASERRADDGSVEASGCYLAPIEGAAYLNSLLNLEPALRGYDLGTDEPGEQTLAVPGELPGEARAVVERARDEGAVASGRNAAAQVEVVRWLISYFTDGSFSYSLDAPGGEEGNLEAIDAFLQARSGYCTHYATAFALLARELGVPSRVAMGFLPSDATDESGAYVVTMRQLHAWAEVWLDGIGWVGVDVTPAAGTSEGGISAEGEAEVEQPSAPEASQDDEPSPDATSMEEPTETAQQNDASPDEKDEGADVAPVAWRAGVLLAAVVVATGGAAVLLARHRRVTTWQAAWARVRHAARRSGVRWDASATEDQIVELICTRLHDDALAVEVRRVARNACQERYGGQAEPFTQPPLRDIARTLRRRRR